MNNQIIDNLKKTLLNLKHKKFSLINIYPTDVYDFENFRKTFKNKLENVVIIQNKNKFSLSYSSDDENIKIIANKTFQDKQEEIFEKTQNGVVIYHNNFEKLEGLQAYYPIIYLANIEDVDEFREKFKNDLEDWQDIYYQNSKLMVLYNKNIKAFQTFKFKEFDIKSSVKINSNKVGYESKLKPDNYINYDIFNNLPKPTIYPPDRKNPKWCQEFYNYLLEIIKIITPVNKERMIPYILNKETFKNNWLKAFTHFTDKPDVTQNYEALEHIGDKALKHAFIDYFYERYPYATSGDLNNATQLTQTDEPQSEIGYKLGLINWVCLEEVLRDNMKLNEDLLESFAGALDISLYQAGIVGGSIPILNNFFKLLYQDYDLFTDINASTWLNQFIEQIAPKDKQIQKEDKSFISLPRPKQIDPKIFSKIIIDVNKLLEKEGIDETVTSEKLEKKKDTGVEWDEIITNDNKVKVDVRLNEYGSKILKHFGFNFKKNQIIGSAIESTKKPAKRHASDNAKEFLAKNGITTKWVEYQNFKRKMGDLEGLEEKALLKAKKKYRDIIMLGIKDKKIKKDAVFVLYGENKKGYKYFLDSYVSDGTPTNNHLLLIKKFLNL